MSHATVVTPKPGHPTLRTPWLSVVIINGDDNHVALSLHLSAEEFRNLAGECVRAASHMERAAAQAQPVGAAA